MDTPICGYKKADEVLCREPRKEKFCDEHDDLRFRVCSGCVGEAVRECSHHLSPGNYCAVALCSNCKHHLDDSHGPADRAPFAPPPPPQADADQLVGLRLELTEVCSRILGEAAKAGLIGLLRPDAQDQVAAKIMADLPTHVTMKLLASLGTTP